MRDSEIVASIVAGDPAGLAAAYDRYAGGLFGYCRSLLHEPADAADVVHDTFVIAAVSLHQLRDPDRLRSWLYAVARNLCLRKLRADKTAAPYPPPEEAEAAEDSDAGGDAERAELRALLRTAADGLNKREREVIELRLWAGLDTAETAAALGVSRAYAHSLLSRAQAHLTESVAVLLVARTGRADCAVLDGLLQGWDGQLTVALRKRLGRHIRRCDVCSDRRRRELRPALLSLWPAGALAAAVSAERARHAAAVPAALKDRVLEGAAAQRASAAGKQALGKNGFPRRATRARTITTCATAVAAAAVLAVVLFGRAHQHVLYIGPPGGGQPVPSGYPPGEAPSVPPGGAPGRGGAGGAGPSPGVTVVPVAASSGGVPPTSPGATAPPSGQPSSVPPSGPSPSSSSPSTSPSSPAPSSAPPTTSPPRSGQGTLAVSPTTVVLTPLLGSTLTLTARNGPVSWSIAEPASLLGELIIAPSSGTLAAGQSARVSISVTGLASLDTTVTVNPGGQRVTVLLGVGVLGG
jgi:RNA polymerase sigma factor (sigma-70 family)